MYNKGIVVFAIILLTLFATRAVAEETPTLSEVLGVLGDPSKHYPEFKKVQYFGDVEVRFFEGGEQEAKEIGLSEEELTNYLRLKFKNNFANIPFKEITFTNWREIHKNQPPHTIGTLRVRVWVVGAKEYITAIHVKINAGTYQTRGVYYEQEALGYGPKKDVLKSIKNFIGEMVEGFALVFSKARGEL